MVKNTVIERVRCIIQSKNISPRAFANVIDFNYATLNGYLSGRRSNVDIDLINRIILSFDNISSKWLITGEGEMMKSSSVAKTETRPRIPYDAAAGTLTESIGGVVEYQCEQVPIISAFPKYDFTITIKGNSMEPEFHSGDEVACLRINEKQFIQWGQIHDSARSESPFHATGYSLYLQLHDDCRRRYWNYCPNGTTSDRAYLFYLSRAKVLSSTGYAKQRLYFLSESQDAPYDSFPQNSVFLLYR